MSASGLIYAAIAIMWAAVLIPMWLRNHESATENRSAERFGQAMRVLSRKEGDPVDHDELDSDVPSAADQRHEVREPIRRPAERPAQRPTERRARSTTSGAPSAAQRFRRAVQTRLAEQHSRPRRARAPLTLVQRRARTLGVLLGLTLVTLMLSAVTPVPWWAPVPFVLLTAAFVVHLRIQALQKQRRRTGARAQTRRRSSSTRPAAHPGAAAREAAAAAQQPATSDESGVVQGPSRAVVVERKGDGAARASADVADRAPGGVSDDPEAWRPNPLPLPTYVTAPKAVRPIKVIDLTTPGAWTSGRLLEDDVAEEDLLAAQVADEELDALIGEEAAAPREATDADGRRAVGD